MDSPRLPHKHVRSPSTQPTRIIIKTRQIRRDAHTEAVNASTMIVMAAVAKESIRRASRPIVRYCSKKT
jgi:hypothetical protein